MKEFRGIENRRENRETHFQALKTERAIDENLNRRSVLEVVDVEVYSSIGFLVSCHFHGLFSIFCR
jgi:hypothetical protein